MNEADGGEGRGNQMAIATLFVDKRYTKAVLDFIYTTDVGKMTEETKIGYGPLTETWAGDAGFDKWCRSEVRRRTETGVG